MSAKLTQKQHRVLEYLQHYVAEHRQAPFIREIQAGCQIASYKSASDRLNALERKRFIRRIPHKHRGIKVLRGVVAATVTASSETPSLEGAV